MSREAIIETFENLAMSCGSYGRLLRALEDMSEYDPGRYEEVMTALEAAGGPVDLIMMVEEG